MKRVALAILLAASTTAGVLSLTAALPPVIAPAQAAVENNTLPLPRFVSLRSSQVNARSGPGVRYPVSWVYMRRDLPVEITAEFETWRKIRDIDGDEGWVHQSMVTGRRMFQVRKDGTRLRSSADEVSAPAAILQAGVIGKLHRCTQGSDYCKAESNGHQGWLRRDEIWGVYKTENVE